MRLLALYYRDVLDYKPKKRREELCSFCQKYIDGFDYALYYRTIEQAVRYSSDKNRKLTHITEVPLYLNEFNYISELELSDNHKKVMLTFLIHMRLNKMISDKKNDVDYTTRFFRGGPKKYNLIKEKANIPASINLHRDILHDLAGLGLVAVLFNGMIVLNFLDNCVEDGAVVIKIKDFDNIGYYYDYLIGKNRVMICDNCGAAFYRKTNSQKYCSPECSRDINLQKTKQRKRLRFENEKQNIAL